MWAEFYSFAAFLLPCWHSHWHHFFFNISTLKVLNVSRAKEPIYTIPFMAFFKVHRLQIEDLLMPSGPKHRIAMGSVAVNTKCSTGETWPIRLYYANVSTLRFYGSADYNLSTFHKELHAGLLCGSNGLHAELHYIRMQGVRCDPSLNLLRFVCLAKCQPTLIYPAGIRNYN